MFKGAKGCALKNEKERSFAHFKFYLSRKNFTVYERLKLSHCCNVTENRK